MGVARVGRAHLGTNPRSRRTSEPYPIDGANRRSPRDQQHAASPRLRDKFCRLTSNDHWIGKMRKFVSAEAYSSPLRSCLAHIVHRRFGAARLRVFSVESRLRGSPSSAVLAFDWPAPKHRIPVRSARKRADRIMWFDWSPQPFSQTSLP